MDLFDLIFYSENLQYSNFDINKSINYFEFSENYFFRNVTQTDMTTWLFV